MTETSDVPSPDPAPEPPRRAPPLTELTLADIPPRVGLFPLSGALLLPGGHLPLLVFEPPYVALLEDALAGRRMIGVIQPLMDPDADEHSLLYRTGTLGRITEFTEHVDGTFSVTLLGISRFRLIREAPTDLGWREGIIDATPFAADLVEEDPLPINRDLLLNGLKTYLDSRDLQASWPLIEDMDDETLLVVLPMLVPFTPVEKQSLLEAMTLDERAGLLLDLLERGMDKS